MRNYLVNVIYGYYFARLLYMINPKLAANLMYRRAFHKNINWDNPKNLIEKYYWLLFNTDISLWTKCADKYRVREYIAKLGCEKILVKLYGVWKNADDINFDNLPNKFVLKSNNGCGTVLIVKDKSTLDVYKTRRVLKKWLRYPYGYNGAQKHYFNIPPCIIAEELLEENLINIKSNSLIDYKIWCFNGRPECVLVAYNRKGMNAAKALYDLNWNNISSKAFNKTSAKQDVPKPQNFDKMIEYAILLSAGFPEVRVDFYNLNGKIYFGEMTFTSGYGTFTEEYYNYLGSHIDLDLYR